MTASLRSSITFGRENTMGETCTPPQVYNCASRPVRSRASSVTSNQSKTEKGTQRKSTSLPSDTVEYLKAWMMSPEHIAHPYPTEQEKCQIMSDTGIELKQLTNWFVNNRKRYWKPRVEAQLKRKVQATHSLSSSFTERGLISPYLTVVSPDNHFPTTRPKRTFKPLTPQTTNFVNTTHPISDCSSYESGQYCQSNDENQDKDVKKLPNSISFHGSNSNTTSQHLYDDSLDLIHESESLSLHILKPSEARHMPSLEDVTILSNVPHECILSSYHNCVIEYDIPRKVIGDQKEIQTIRDTAILQAKKKYLEHFLKSAQNEAPHQVVSDVSSHQSVSSDSCSESLTVVGQSREYRPFKRPRTVTEGSAAKSTAVVKTIPSDHVSIRYQFEDTKKWRDVCSNARSLFDDKLPTLEEAACMFGYVK